MKTVKILLILLLGNIQLFNLAHSATVRIAAKKFTESRIVTQITRQFLKHRGYKIIQRRDKSTRKVRKALLKQEIDLYWEYTGTAFLNFHNQLFTLQSPNEIYQIVKKLDRSNNIIWLNTSKVNNNYAIAIKNTFKPSIKTFSEFRDLLDIQPFLLFGCNFEFCRLDGEVENLQTFYNFKFTQKNIKTMDLGDIYEQLKTDKLTAGLVFSSDAKLYNSGLIILEDDKNFFVSYQLTPVIRSETLTKYPHLESDLNLLSQYLDTQTMIRLNAKVQIDQQKIWRVAKQFLLKNHLI